VFFLGGELEGLVSCLTERQKSYTKWHATRTSRNVSHFLTLAVLTGSTEIGLQATNCREIFEIGSLLLIHGKITTLLASRATKGRRRGSSKATCSRNGKHPGQVPFFGSTGNVS